MIGLVTRREKSPLKMSMIILETRRATTQWRTQKLFVWGADEVFNHIFKGCGRVFCLKYTLIFFFQGAKG
ncbi:hypothetical protein Hanom_Chr01g00082651 [Helianthus anomalus]